MGYDLGRFLKVQEKDYPTALAEIRNGEKESHWIWYIFPQLTELGQSPTAKFYGLSGLEEARAYLAHPLLRERLTEISSALLELDSDDAEDVMGWPDDLKLCSSMTLFAEAEPENAVFQKVLGKFFGGKKDPKTLDLLKK